MSLLTRLEVIMALNKVRAECNKVTAMTLFHSNLSKSSRLEEFEQIQSQTFTQVELSSLCAQQGTPERPVASREADWVYSEPGLSSRLETESLGAVGSWGLGALRAQFGDKR